MREAGALPREVAVMGGVVNGPGESKRANLGIRSPAPSRSPTSPFYTDGEHTVTSTGDHIAEEIKRMDDVGSQYPARLAEPAGV